VYESYGLTDEEIKSVKRKMKPIQISLPYFDSFRPTKRKEEKITHPFGQALAEFSWRMIQTRMFLREIECYTRKIDKRITVKLLGHEFQIPALVVKESTKKSLVRNRREVERMLSDGMIIIVMSVVEYALRDFCDALEASKQSKSSRSESWENPLDQFKTCFKKAGGEIVDEDWQYLKAINRLRNTLAHSMGEIGARDRLTLERLSKKYPRLKIVDGCVFPSLEFTHEIIDKVSMVFAQWTARFTLSELEDMNRRARSSANN
jgi:hypothetical protein